MYFQIENSSVRVAGATHFFPKESPDIPTWLGKAYNWCEDIIFESDPTTNPDASRHARSNLALYEQLSLKTWLNLCLRWPGFVTRRKMRTLKPWAVLMLLPHLFQPLVPGVERQLAARARRESKPIGELENSFKLAQILDTIPVELIEEQIQFHIRHGRALRQQVFSLHRAWRSGDHSAVAAVVEKAPILSCPALRRGLLYIRNNNWMTSFQKAAQSRRRTLIVVGVAHLCGEANVAELYQKQFGDGFSPMSLT